MSPPRRHVPTCICSGGSPASPALRASVLRGPGPALSAPLGLVSHPSSAGTPLLPAAPLPSPFPLRRVRPSLRGAGSSTGGSVYSSSPSTAPALREQQDRFFLKCGGFLSYSPLFIYLFIIFSFTLFYFTILYRFCHTSTGVRHGCTRVPSPERPSHLPPYAISPGHPRAPAPCQGL